MNKTARALLGEFEAEIAEIQDVVENTGEPEERHRSEGQIDDHIAPSPGLGRAARGGTRATARLGRTRTVVDPSHTLEDGHLP